MIFNKHSELEGLHAHLSASKYHWLNYDDEKLARSVITALAAQRGTRLHEFAHMAIELGQKMPKTGQTINRYVNDALGFRMRSEVVLFYSPNCFGTADTIGFKDNYLRIHDLKTGVHRCSFKQLLIYAALFCLEYGFRPHELAGIELRIYQNDETFIEIPDPHDVLSVMDKIVSADKIVSYTRMEATS